MSQLLINKLRAARQSWVDLEPGKRVQIIRPAETELGEFLHYGQAGELQAVADVPQCKRFVTGWDGITEADLLGAAIGSSDALPFTVDLWAEVVGDRSDWCRVVSEALVKAITDHVKSRDEATKN